MNVHKETVGLYNQYEEEIYAKEEEGVSVVMGRVGGNK